MKKFLFLFLALTSAAFSGCSQSKSNGTAEKQVGGRCEDCELMFAEMPENLTWKTTVADAGEPGERLIISGTIFKKDGKTPAPGVILYIYHTNNSGKYSPAFNQTQARRHGHLRGWVKTNERGRYEFTTIRPAAYPNRKDPQHIHPIIKEPEVSLYWIDEFLFDDDPLVTEQVRAKQEKRGGSGIIKLTKNTQGVWIGKRDIILGLNIPGY